MLQPLPYKQTEGAISESLGEALAAPWTHLGVGLCLSCAWAVVLVACDAETRGRVARVDWGSAWGGGPRENIRGDSPEQSAKAEVTAVATLFWLSADADAMEVDVHCRRAR